MDNIEDIVKRVIGNIADKRGASVVNIEEVWNTVMDVKELEHTQLIGINNGILSVSVDSPAWGYHLKVKKNDILQKVKDRIPEIQDIRFKIGNVR